MTTSADARAILDAFVAYSRDEHGLDRPENRPPKLATVDAVGTVGAEVTFDGETSGTGTEHRWLGAPPVVGARVLMLPVGRGYVIAGAVSGPDSVAPVSAFREAAGSVFSPSLSAGASGSVNVYFPAGRFTVPPLVTLGVGQTRINAAVEEGDTTTTYCVISFANNTSAAVLDGPVAWHAVQMTPTSASG